VSAVRFLLPAEVEVVQAAAYYETQVEGLGNAFLAKVESAVRDVAQRPSAWPVLRSEIRKRLVHRFPYAVLYRVDTDAVVIVADMHQRRRPEYWIGRT
jgi:plasmid stabilization system protein ParE